MQRPVFVVISKTDTAVGSQRLTSSYNHVSISFSKDLNVMYAFSRYRINSPFVGGFVSEKPARYILNDTPTPIKIYMLMADDEDYEAICQRVDKFRKDKKIYIYNTYADIAHRMGKEKKIKYALTSVEFVCRVLEIRGVSTISQLEKELEYYLVYVGTLDKYLRGEYECDDMYFNRQNPMKVFTSTVGHFARLTKRALFNK